MRIHIGKISPALAEKINELEQRLDRYGRRTSPLSLHRKEFGSFYFAFVDMDIDKKQYGALCTALNGVMFRQSKLEVKQAEPKYEDRMQIGKKDEGDSKPKLNPEQLKRLRSAPAREINVFPGRMRESSQIRMEPTFRVKIKDDIRKPKMRKRKLWGIEKRPLSKLADHFVDGEWRDSEGKAIEIVSSLLDEHAQAQRIAEDFAKSGAYLSDSDFEEFKETARDIGQGDSDDEIEVVPRSAPTTSSSTTPKGTDSFSSDEDAGNDDDNYDNTNENTNGFRFDGQYTPMEVDGQPAPENSTEMLRSALSADAPFTLFGGPSEAPAAAESAPSFTPTTTPAAMPVVSEPKVGLFFLHAKSPYLRSQSQAAKLVDEFDAKAWETEFFENRGEWNRSLRKRRRDAHRMARRMGKKRGEQ